MMSRIGDYSSTIIFLVSAANLKIAQFRFTYFTRIRKMAACQLSAGYTFTKHRACAKKKKKVKAIRIRKREIMAYLDLDLKIGRKARAIQETARQFGMETARPAGIELDKLSDPAEVVAEGSVYWEALKKFREAGLH